MDARPHRRRGSGALPLLNAAIETMNLAKELSSVTPAQALFGSVSVILTMIKVGFSSPPLNRRLMYPGFDGQQSRLC